MERVVVRARGYVDASMKDEYSKIEFHMLDLKRGKVIHNLMPPLLTNISIGGVVSLGSTVYMLGGSAISTRPLHRHRHRHRPPPEPKNQVYLGASRFDFNFKSKIDDDGWKSAPLPIKSEDSSVFIPLLGKIYGFGLEKHCVEVFDPTLNQWMMLGPIPSPFNQCGINTLLVLPDPKNRRIIVSFCNDELDTMPLCVYYPPVAVGDDDTDTDTGRGRWECINYDFPLCNHVVALVDDVLYIFHEHDRVLLRAYDLTTNQWLDITWTTTLPDGAVKEFFRWDTLFVLYDNVLCFASWSPRDDFKQTGIEITLLKFRVERSSASTIHVTFLDGQGYDLPSSALIYDLLPLDQEAFC